MVFVLGKGEAGKEASKGKGEAGNEAGKGKAGKDQRKAGKGEAGKGKAGKDQCTSSSGNDLVDNSWNNVSEEHSVKDQPALTKGISDMAELMHIGSSPSCDHHYVIYGGSGMSWYVVYPSQTLGESFDRNRDWVLNTFKEAGVLADSGEKELMQARYTVDDVDRFHHRVSGTEKAISTVLQWIERAAAPPADRAA